MERVAGGRLRVRRMAFTGVVVALIAGVLALAGPGAVSGQESPGCDARDLGTLSGSADAVLEAKGRWSTGDCD